MVVTKFTSDKSETKIVSIQKLVVLFLECTYFLRFLIRTQLVIPTDHWNIVRWVDNDQALGKTTWIRLV